MKLTQEFVVAGSIGPVWLLCEDVAAITQCLPGADLTGQTEEGGYTGKVAVKLGPLNPTFEGEATIDHDREAWSIALDGSGVDRQGGSRGRATVNVRFSEVDEGTRVTVDADIVLSGAAARFGRTGLMEEMAGRLLREFAACLEAKLEATTPGEAEAVHAGEVHGFSLLISSFIAWIRRLFGRS